MDSGDVTVLILTFNEEANIGRTLGALSWARRIVVVDSGSTHRTREIVEAAPGTVWLERPFDSHSAQWNFGLSQVATDWALTLDADYVCASSLVEELRTLPSVHDAYEAAFTYVIHGHTLRATLYPPRVVLFRARTFRYAQDGHTQRLLTGHASVGRLSSRIAHDDRKAPGRWFEAQHRYAKLEADRLSNSRTSELSWVDRVRRAVVWMPVLTPLYCLVGRGLAFDGWPGVSYTLERTYAEVRLSMALVERRLGRPDAGSDVQTGSAT